MMAHVHYSEAELEAGLAHANEVHGKLTGEPGARGVQARLNIAVTAPLARFVYGEVNRGTDIDDIRFAIAGMVANLAMTLSELVLGDEPSPPERVGEINKLMADFSHCLNCALSGTAAHTVVFGMTPIEGGHA